MKGASKRRKKAYEQPATNANPTVNSQLSIDSLLKPSGTNPYCHISCKSGAWIRYRLYENVPSATRGGHENTRFNGRDSWAAAATNVDAVMMPIGKSNQW